MLVVIKIPFMAKYNSGNSSRKKMILSSSVPSTSFLFFLDENHMLFKISGLTNLCKQLVAMEKAQLPSRKGCTWAA
jgi:hypothetical protein